jgi:hypothetical protein
LAAGRNLLLLLLLLHLYSQLGCVCYALVQWRQ